MRPSAVIGVPPAGARRTRPSGRLFAVARHPLSGAVGCPWRVSARFCSGRRRGRLGTDLRDRA